jgi:two-component system sensor histidine kinase MtrB
MRLVPRRADLFRRVRKLRGARRGLRLRPGLSVRITAMFTFGALLISGAIAAGVSFATGRFLLSQQERNVLHQTYVNAAIVRARLSGPNPNIPELLDALTTGGSAQTVISTGGRWYSSSLLVSRDTLPSQLRNATLRGSVETQWTRLNGIPELAVGVPLPAVQSAYFQVTDESSLQRTLSIVGSVLIAAAAVTTAAGAGVGWWASRRLTAPLRAVTAAAERISSGDLGTRLPDTRDPDIAGLASSFNTMVTTLRDRMDRDARFAANVSHELRSPLTTLTTSLGLLEARRDELSPRGRDALALLGNEVRRFDRLVDDLLEISRADTQTGIADAEPVRIGELLLHLLHEPPYATVHTEFRNGALAAAVIGDKRRLQQVLRNLLDNAEMHAGGAKQVTVTATATTVDIDVDDAGPGVPEAERHRIFDRFARGRTASRTSAGGSGLGLALVAEHVRLHGGSVSVSSSPFGGARFTVSLPRGHG